MKGLFIPDLFIVVAAVCSVLGGFSRLALTPIAGIESRAFGGFAAICLLFAIALTLRGKDK